MNEEEEIHTFAASRLLFAALERAGRGHFRPHWQDQSWHP